MCVTPAGYGELTNPNSNWFLSFCFAFLVFQSFLLVSQRSVWVVCASVSVWEVIDFVLTFMRSVSEPNGIFMCSTNNTEMYCSYSQCCRQHSRMTQWSGMNPVANAEKNEIRTGNRHSTRTHVLVLFEQIAWDRLTCIIENIFSYRSMLSVLCCYDAQFTGSIQANHTKLQYNLCGRWSECDGQVKTN